VGGILTELARIKAVVPAEELNKAREMAKGRLLLRTEDSRSVAAFLGTQELLQGGIRAVDEVVDRINAVTAEDVQRVARQVLVHDRMCLAVVGPLKDEMPLHNVLAVG
jgi:predicted Zn-dependent peptidase